LYDCDGTGYGSAARNSGNPNMIGILGFPGVVVVIGVWCIYWIIVCINEKLNDFNKNHKILIRRK